MRDGAQASGSSNARTATREADEDQLTQLDADVERQQGDRNRLLRQADFGQRAGEPEAVQQAEA